MSLKYGPASVPQVTVNDQPAKYFLETPLNEVVPWGAEGNKEVISGSYLRLIDSCITQLKAQGPSRTCNESKEEEEDSRTSSRLR